MKTKSFKAYLEKRLNDDEIQEIEKQAELEVELLRSLQDDISRLVTDYMARESIGFNELVRRLNITPAQLSKIQRGEANLTLASIAHLCALLKIKPHFTVNENNFPHKATSL